MSIIDTVNHNVVSYTSGVTKAFSGQRLIVLTYKTVTDKNSALCGIKRESKAVSVPVIPDAVITSNLVALLPHVRSMLENTQKLIVRDLLDAGNNVASIAVTDIDVTACIEYLESSDDSGRMTKESVGKWFDDAIAPMLALTISDKLGMSDTPSQQESDKVLNLVAAFKRDISALAGGKTSYSVKVATQLQKAIALVDGGDVIASKFNARLEKMISAKEVDYLDAL